MPVVTTDVGSITAVWTDPTGTDWTLTNHGVDSPGWFTLPGPSGWNATTYELVTDPIARGGESLRFIRAKPGRILWPLYIFGETHLAYLANLRAIKRAFTMTLHRRTPATLTVSRPDGTSRSIQCYYESGFEGEHGEGWLWSKDTVTLFCPDGYWQDSQIQTVTYSYTPGVDFLAPFPQVSAGLSFGDSTMTNVGDVDAWPTWTLTGPMSAFSATNLSTGYQWTLTYPLLAGEQITVTTYQPTVRGPAGQNLASALDWPDAYLWWLAPGDNDVVLNVSGADVGSSVQIDYYPRYEGA